MRGFYGSDARQVRDEIACAWYKKQNKKRAEREKCSYGKEGDR